MWYRSTLIGVLLLAVGCAAKQQPGNSSFPVTVEQAQRVLDDMEKDRKPLDRPVVILNGFLDPGFGGGAVGELIRQHTSNAQIITVAYPLEFSFEGCRRKVMDAVQRAYPSTNPAQTRCVDVIGLSMGGLLARYCAVGDAGGAGGADGRRLNICRLFTISSPHQGASRAERWPAMLQMQRDMRPHSEFLQRLGELEKTSSYELIPYSLLGDYVVGARYAATSGQMVWWLPKEPGQHPHIGAARDPRIIADILRRLRGERPLTKGKPATIPAGEE